MPELNADLIYEKLNNIEKAVSKLDLNLSEHLIRHQTRDELCVRHSTQIDNLVKDNTIIQKHSEEEAEQLRVDFLKHEKKFDKFVYWLLGISFTASISLVVALVQVLSGK